MSAGVRGYATSAGLQGGRRLERREVSERGPEWPDGSARPALETPTESDFTLSRRNRSVGSFSALLVAKDVREPVKAGAVAFIYVHSPE